MHMDPVAYGNCYNISKIHLALHVVCSNSVERLKQKLRVNTVNTGINFPDLLLSRGRIFFFHNARNVSVLIGDNPSIVMRLCNGGRHYRNKRSTLEMNVQELLKRLRCDQGSIATENKNRTGMRA